MISNHFPLCIERRPSFAQILAIEGTKMKECAKEAILLQQKIVNRLYDPEIKKSEKTELLMALWMIKRQAPNLCRT